MRTGEEDAWETLREKIMELEEGGTWREYADSKTVEPKGRG